MESGIDTWNTRDGLRSARVETARKVLRIGSLGEQ